jgi:hypothetical protein
VIVTLKVTKYTHDAEGIELRAEPDADCLTLQFADVLPQRDDRIRSEDGRSFRVEWREWLPGGLVLHVTERVTEERAA